jgi:ferritin-like metal-binding protein YciE
MGRPPLLLSQLQVRFFSWAACWSRSKVLMCSLTCGRRLERIISLEGLIAEGEDYVKASGDKDVRDAGLIGAAQRVEHYEFAGYGTARTLATRLGESGC